MIDVKRSSFGPRKKTLKSGAWPIPSAKQRVIRGEARRRVKTRGDHIQELQAAFNEWVRLRDAGRPCISCGSYRGDWHAGHYRSVGSEPALRFEPDNAHLQCARCNTYLAGNLTAYRSNLIEKIGLDRVEWLEGKHPPQKLTIADIQEMKVSYRQKIRELKKASDTDLEAARANSNNPL